MTLYYYGIYKKRENEMNIFSTEAERNAFFFNDPTDSLLFARVGVYLCYIESHKSLFKRDVPQTYHENYDDMVFEFQPLEVHTDVGIKRMVNYLKKKL